MAMEEKTTETMPRVERSPGWKPRRQQKRTLVESKLKPPQEPEESAERAPEPLPFGTLDVFA